jgi:hypothetical protein
MSLKALVLAAVVVLMGSQAFAAPGELATEGVSSAPWLDNELPPASLPPLSASSKNGRPVPRNVSLGDGGGKPTTMLSGSGGGGA